MKHPILLPHHHPITTLIIAETHQVLLHGGFSLTLASLTRKYLITRGRDTVRNILRKCIVCRKVKAVTAQQLMGSLPTSRVSCSRPFLHSGVDFAGPFQIKVRKGRHIPVEKAYLAIFVCMSTKATHLEAVTSLSSEAFIACFERFISRRGTCAKVYSDCGTNFVGADRILQQFLEEQKSSLGELLSNKGCNWQFNPPAAPHQGGLWEAGVQSVKYHLKRVVGDQILTHEQFQTLLCKVEACLNSRPLCALSSDPNDMEALTPGHFLIGEPLTSIPEPDVSLVKKNRLSYWEEIRQMTQHFWRRWKNEYLVSLQQRFKWKIRRDNVKVGDLVVLNDDQLPTTKWSLGRIQEVFPGTDGLVRSVIVKTATGEFKRPITKLSPLIPQDQV